MIFKFGSYIVALGAFNGLVFGIEFSIPGQFVMFYVGPFSMWIGKSDPFIDSLLEE